MFLLLGADHAFAAAAVVAAVAAAYAVAVAFAVVAAAVASAAAASCAEPLHLSVEGGSAWNLFAGCRFQDWRLASVTQQHGDAVCPEGPAENREWPNKVAIHADKSVFAITSGHRTISRQLCHVTDQSHTCVDKMSGRKRAACSLVFLDEGPQKARDNGENNRQVDHREQQED